MPGKKKRYGPWPNQIEKLIKPEKSDVGFISAL
jgi:hypothetical protein